MIPQRHHTTIVINDIEWDAVGYILYDEIRQRHEFTFDFILKDRSIIYAAQMYELDLNVEHMEDKIAELFTDSMGDFYDE